MRPNNDNDWSQEDETPNTPLGDPWAFLTFDDSEESNDKPDPQQGFPLTHSTTQKNLSLHSAAFDNDIDSVKSILKQNSSIVNDKDSLGKTALHLAVENGHKKVVKALIRAGADVNQKDSDNNTPLESGIKNNSHNILSIYPLFKNLAPQAFQVYDVDKEKFVPCIEITKLDPSKNGSYTFITASLKENLTASNNTIKDSANRKRKFDSSSDLKKSSTKRHCSTEIDFSTNTISLSSSPIFRPN